MKHIVKRFVQNLEPVILNLNRIDGPTMLNGELEIFRLSCKKPGWFVLPKIKFVKYILFKKIIIGFQRNRTITRKFFTRVTCYCSKNHCNSQLSISKRVIFTLGHFVTFYYTTSHLMLLRQFLVTIISLFLTRRNYKNILVSFIYIIFYV